MAYVFRSPSGTFLIGPDEEDLSLCKLCIGGLWLRSFETEEAAAAAVRDRCTGWPEWDRADKPCGPDDLSGWEEI
ncbi:MAG TPA: hypothetical protein PKY58_02525 [Syntrophales bacterium]|nr:hypothetical protein [Syntrophales bacterium]HQN77012.1 hypothetical protein [Syntrophales bacterium]HQQ26377.1 hypothetical protein [Syntrophales bacterium]